MTQTFRSVGLDYVKVADDGQSIKLVLLSSAAELELIVTTDDLNLMLPILAKAAEQAKAIGTEGAGMIVYPVQKLLVGTDGNEIVLSLTADDSGIRYSFALDEEQARQMASGLGRYVRS